MPEANTNIELKKERHRIAAEVMEAKEQKRLENEEKLTDLVKRVEDIEKKLPKP